MLRRRLAQAPRLRESFVTTADTFVQLIYLDPAGSMATVRLVVQMPFEVPYGLPISLDRAEAVIRPAVAEAKKRNWKMSVAATSSPSNQWTARCLPPFRLPGSPTKTYEDGIHRLRWSHCLSRRHSADRLGDDYRRNRLFERHGFPERDRPRGRDGSN
jgi:hypothetical protein